jgi:hypothetical protein
MKMPNTISETMLAPCGITCAVCYVHLKPKKACLGCRGVDDENKPNHCRTCKIKTCAMERGVEFCSACPTYPCAIVKRLDQSYRKRYKVSLIDNAQRLKTLGAEAFLQEERTRWTCADCGGVISLHDGVCSECGNGKT